MYGGSGKLGRGRGGGPPVKRNINSTFQPSSVQRPSATPPGGRLSTGGGHRSRSNTPAAPATVSMADETFSLVRNSPLNFGMIIRLSPVLVEEIKRLEAQGGAARIKFDSSANNPAGNVIDVGGKEFRFTWSQETGDLCDIYEERKGGDNGDGLLVESGGAWRKINVQRELDESVKNHVKMRTVEAERKHKSRKAIILDHGNPSMKNQMKALAAAEVNNTWKGSYNKKKEPPFKKMKAEPSSAIIPPKSGGKTGFSSSTPSKVRASASPLLSTPEQSGAPLSPLRNSNITKVHANREDASLTQYSKENASTSEKEMFSSVPAGAVQSRLGSNGRFGNKPTDLQSLLICLLMEKPHGMNFKALEKAVGETFPKSVKQIEPILKKIAVFQAPGRYILKPDVELESLKKTSSESGSFLDNKNHHREAAAPESSFSLKNDIAKQFEEPAHIISEPYEELNTSEKIDIDHLSPDVFNDKKVSNNSEGPAVSSSRSGSGSDSDSDSDSSDTGSESRSPGSSSDSGSDASANSKQGSDEEVDIMSDDDIEPRQKLLPSDPEVGYAHNMVDENDDGHQPVLVEPEKDLFNNEEAEMNVTTNLCPDKDGDNYADDTTGLFVHLDHQESEFHATKAVSKNNFKRGSDEKHFDENEHAKRLKSGNQAQPIISRGRNSNSDSPMSDWPNEDPYKGTTNQMIGRTVRDVSDYDEYDKVDNREFIGNSPSDSPRSGLRPRLFDLNAQENDVFLLLKDNKANRQIRDEDGHSKDRRPPKNSGGKHSGSHQKKHGGSSGKIKESGYVSTSQIKDSIVDLKNSPVINGRGPTLRREISDLEMGELRENLHEEASGGKKRFEKNNSFKQSDNKSSSDYWNLDESKGKLAGRTNVDSVKVSPFQSGIGMSGTQQILPKKAVPEDHVDDFTRVNGKPVSRVDHAKAESQNSKGRRHEAGASQGFGSEGYMDSQRKVPVVVPQKHEKQVVSITTKDKKRHKSKDLGAKKKDFWPVNKRREMESCTDDSITSYAKYEKEEPEMKGPIRDLSQYNDYVQEYREKYDSYYTLNKLLESYRNKFQTFASDLELAKGRDSDRYNKIVEQLMESYSQCGMKHKRLKKIFIVLHHELQHLKEMIKDFANKQMKG